MDDIPSEHITLPDEAASGNAGGRRIMTFRPQSV
jgi:hypothetical protein